MAEPIINEQFEEFIGSRNLPGQSQLEYFNKENNLGFGNEAQLFNFAGAVSGKPITGWADLAQPFRVDAPKEIPAPALEQPKSRFDLDTLMAENDKVRQQLLSTFAPSGEEISLQKRLFELQNEDRATELSALAGINKAEDNIVPMEVITGDQDKIMRQANLALQTNAFRQQPIVQSLQLFQQQREALQKTLMAQQEFGQFDMNMAFQFQQLQKQEQEKAKEFALKYSVTTPAYSPDGITVYATSDGKPLTEPEFFARFGFKDWKEVPKGFIQTKFETAEDRAMAFEREQFEFTKDMSLAELGLKKQDLILKQAELQLKTAPGANFDQTMNLLKSYLGQSKTFIEVKESWLRIQASAQNPSAAGDLALIFNYMKMLDPGSVVREGEFATAQNSAGVPEQIRARYNKVLNGERLGDDQRNDFVNRAGSLYDAQKSQQANIESIFRRTAEQFSGVDANIAIPDLSTMPGDDPTLNQGWDGLLEGKNPVDINAALNSGGLSVDGPVSKSKNSFFQTIAKASKYFGSPLWSKGLDYVVAKGTPLPSPFAGTVESAGYKKGWGNQVAVRLSDGSLALFNHLDKINVKPGQKIGQSSLLGTIGNTGNVLKSDGTKPTAKELAAGRGSHLDLTIKNPKGSYLSAKEVETFVNKYRTLA